jgi:thymidylate kinase
VIRRLFECLEELGVNYCHWKSNIRLTATLAGQEDIDLLVDSRSDAQFHAALAQCGFRTTFSRSGSGHPGVFHALALDSATGELVDLHAYYQVVSGDSLVKNYRFPIERLILDSTCYLEGVRVPDPSAELALFVLRIALKHVSPVEILKTNRHYSKVVAELAWLCARADSGQAAALCASWFPAMEPALFERLRQAVAGDALLPRVMLGWQVAWRLGHLRRMGLLRATASRYRRLLLFVVGRLRRRRDLALQTGGAIIALVGPKGTGKSTVGGALAGRLGRYLCVRRIHVGKPPTTLLSFLPRLFLPLGRLLLPHERLREYQSVERRQTQRYSMLYVLRMLLVAYDRRRLIFRALRVATSGAVVIADRYPSETARAIDSSCFDDAAVAACRSRLKRWMMKHEQAFYRDLPRPTLVLQLVAQLDLALERDARRNKRGGPDPEAVRRRWHLESETNFSSTPVVCVDASRPLDETVRFALQAVWERL